MNKITTIILVLSVGFSCSVKNISVKEDLLYDKLTKKYVYIGVEKMPKYKGGDRAYTTDFFKYFHYDYSAKENIQTKLSFQFVIDKNGNLIGARIYNKKAEEGLTDFEKAGLKAMKRMQNWEQGEHQNKPVNVLITTVIHIDPQW